MGYINLFCWSVSPSYHIGRRNLFPVYDLLLYYKQYIHHWEIRENTGFDAKALKVFEKFLSRERVRERKELFHLSGERVILGTIQRDMNEIFNYENVL